MAGHVPWPRRAAEVFLSSLRLGVTSFGGPVAHLGYMRREYVERRGWLDEESYAALVALCQVLPGPASSQLNMAIGIRRAGAWGALLAWFGFTLPSAFALTAFALLTRGLDVAGAAWLHGIMLAAVAVVAQAVATMAPRLAPDARRAGVAAAAATVMLLVPAVWTQVAVIVAAAVLGRLLLPPLGAAELPGAEVRLPRWLGVTSAALLAALLVGLPAARAATGSGWLLPVDGFFRAGALVFGGGHVVLPLLHQVAVPAGGISDAAFLAGYGAAQAVPGPLFTFAAYLGALWVAVPGGGAAGAAGVAGAAVALAAIFLPSFLLLFALLPTWSALQRQAWFSRSLAGINAAVLGMLAAALYAPVWTGAVRAPVDAAIALAAFVALRAWNAPPWVVVAGCAGLAALARTAGLNF